MTRRIIYPDGSVRTREQILDGLTIVGGVVWLTCHNCGGSGDYPSSMTPPGRCRLYCWRDRTSETFGKLPYGVDWFVKREQAHDRREYRHKLAWEADAPAREERAARAAAEQQDREAEERYWAEAMAMAKAARVWLGTIGQRITIAAKVEAKVRLEGGQFGDRYLVRFRDATQNLIVWWTGNPGVLREGLAVTFLATVKDHERYQGEAQTIVQRVKLAS